MQNTLVDLNNHLFAELERLGDEDLTKEGLQNEVARAKAITGIASEIVNNANTLLRATALNLEYGGNVTNRILIGNDEAKRNEFITETSR